jgi:hypothetical protein
MAQKKLSQLPVSATISANDKVLVLANTGGSAYTAVVAANIFTNTFKAKKLEKGTVPAANTSNGTIGDIAFNNSHIYICVANNTWARAALTLSW